ncbi:hypothetical protein BV898_03407 [Hypsibius exemplaris]|uniref:Craniofacial development protein 1 n=1 Tax=Hypsibius exemplaris TaxID=2072580 RepID=A0A1W0X5I0_HYPEX|nr:hypothetical protein BV898_03407 [Hypsibius exemplaris]
MAHPFRRGAQGDSSESSDDDDYVPPEQVEVEDDETDSAGADLEPSSGGDTDLDVGKRKRKRKVRGRKKRQKTDGDTSDNNDETTSNETLLSLPLKSTSTTVLSPGTTSDSKSGGDQSSSPSPAGALSGIEPRLSARLNGLPLSHSALPAKEERPARHTPPKVPVTAGPSKSTLGSALAKLAGRKKPSVLEKSQAHWKEYKSAEKLEEELTSHNKGKGGYLDRKDFLERANVREFEFGLNSKSAGSK